MADTNKFGQWGSAGGIGAVPDMLRNQMPSAGPTETTGGVLPDSDPEDTSSDSEGSGSAAITGDDQTYSAPAQDHQGQSWHGAGLSGYWGDTGANPLEAWTMDDGGEVPGDMGMVDPMEMVKNALSYGRKKMGLPEQFYPSSVDNEQNGSVEQQGFDDGGGVLPIDEGQEQGGQMPQQGGQMPDPRATLQYLTGAGAVTPDIAAALEQRADPQGMMDPSERKMKALASAGSPDTQFAYLQSLRQKFGSYSGAARAALSKGDMTNAARYATQAMAHVPTGNAVKFAPARGGFAMVSRPHGASNG
jgi:hypothetical protein